MNTIALEQQLLISGRLLSETVKSKKQIASLSEVEFKVFSQWGDDGIIQWLVNNLELPNKTFIEFGVENYRESNTRFLMMNDNWSGLVMDGSESNVAQIINSEYFWKYELLAKAVFIDKDNINSLISSSGFEKEVGILHIDVDGNDYWIWKEIDVISPIIVIMEYNSIFGIDKAITTPYDKQFFRTNAHHSNLYFGASLRAFYQLSIEKGYSFIGCNSAGNNAYFVRKDKLNSVVEETSLENGYVMSKFRQSRNKEGYLTCLSWNDSIAAIRGMPIYNIDTNQIESLFELNNIDTNNIDKNQTEGLFELTESSDLSSDQLPLQAKEYKVGNHNILLPLDHALDRYQSNWKRYDTVLANVAQIIFQKYPTLTAIDIGANVGDSAALINKYIHVPVLCIEGYYKFLPFLEYNAAQIGGIKIAPYFVGNDGETLLLEQVSSQSGTASIVNTSQEMTSNNQIILKSLSTILELYPEFKSSKLLKIDADGYDFDIINQSIDIINSLQPVICFEYDITFRENGEIESLEAIENLVNIGYSYFLIYDNFGNYLINLTDNDYEKFLDLNTYLICNRRKSGTVAVFYFDIYAFSSNDYDLFSLVKDTEIYG